MNQFYFNFLQEHLEKQKDSIESYKIENKKVWLKKASSRHSSWIYLPLTWFSKIFGLGFLKPVPNYGGEISIKCEVKRIQQLSQTGIHVPEILAYSSQGILLKDAARENKPVLQLQEALKQEASTETRLSLYTDAIQQIQSIHNASCYLSEAFSRNILVDQDRNFSFIDFETDPGEVLTLDECYARDWLCFIFSTASCFNEDEIDQVRYLLRDHLIKDQKTYHTLCKVGRKIKWILKLKLEKLGSDGRRLNKCILLLALLDQEK
jgi:tRNA A-37 threonylcarbamoyl transferase component Bud32